MKEEKTLSNKLIFSAIGVCLYAFFIGFVIDSFSSIVKIALILSIFLIMILFLISIAKKNEKLYKFNIVCVYFALICILLINIVVKSGILTKINDMNSIVALIQDSGINGKLIFILIQFLQVTFVPIPSSIVSGAGAIIFSRQEALLLSCIGLWIGSFVAFLLGRVFGVKLVKWMVGEESLKKYYQMVKGRDKTLLAFMFVFPVFPDDLLCLIAGLTSMKFSSFLIIQLISRPLNVAFSVYLVEIAKIIPFSGWGLVIWAMLIIVGAVLLIWAFKNSERLEKFMLNIINKILRKSNIEKVNIELEKDNEPQIIIHKKVDYQTLEEDPKVIEEREKRLLYEKPKIKEADKILENKDKDIKIDY